MNRYSTIAACSRVDDRCIASHVLITDQARRILMIARNLPSPIDPDKSPAPQELAPRDDLSNPCKLTQSDCQAPNTAVDYRDY